MPKGDHSVYGLTIFNGVLRGMQAGAARGQAARDRAQVQQMQQENLDLQKKKVGIDEQMLELRKEEMRRKFGREDAELDIKKQEHGLRTRKESADELNNLRSRFDQLTDTELKYNKELGDVMTM